MSVTERKLDKLFEPVIKALGYELLGIRYIPQGKRSLLRVYIDSKEGVTVDDCSLASAQLSALLDVENPISGGYMLEVSSPGFDRPLFKPEHYLRFKGREIDIRLSHAGNGRRKFKGHIIDADKNSVSIEEKGDNYVLDYSAIGLARLVPDLS